ncbi:MAG: hypothetical protein PHU23_16260 [Dehalococcoidales bacterium]|nr:hypothetical protein [Dehalococcoidales bacterium]
MPKSTKKNKFHQRKHKKQKISMQKYTNNKSKSQKQKPWEAIKMKMFQTPQLLPPEIPKEKRLEILRDIGTKAKAEFEIKFPTIEKWFREYDSLYLLSFCAFYFVAEPEGTDREACGQLDFYHHYLEIMQAFALYQDRNYNAKPLLQDAKKLKSEIEELGELMSIRILNIPQGVSSDEEMNAYMLRSEMMSHTTAVRNWAYVHQMKRTVFDLAERIGPVFQVVYEIHPINILKILCQLSEERNALLNDHLRKIRSCMKKNNYKEMIDSYNKAFPENEKIEEDKIELLWKKAGKDKNNLAGLLICHSDLKLENIYSFTFEHAQSLLENKKDCDALEVILSKLSLQFGELKDFNKEHIILNNPVLRKPFIKLDDKNYFSVIWGVMPHLLLDILEDFIWEKQELKSTYTDLKAKYLEDEIDRLFSNAFPSGSIYRGSIWYDPKSGKNFENDLIILIDSFAIIVEAKSGKISDPARRGAPDRLAKTLKELIEYNTPRKLDRGIRCMLACQNEEGEMAWQRMYGEGTTRHLRPELRWKR